MNNIYVYILYLSLATLITVGVGRDLHKNGYFLILDLFQNKLFAKTVNNLLLTGYYLVNLGYVAIVISNFGTVDSLNLAMNELSKKLGAILLILGFLHFNNIILLHLLSRRKQIIKLFNT